MKIYFINDTFNLGRGADTVIYELAKRIGKKNSVEVLCTESTFPEENFKIKKIKGSKLFRGGIKDFLFPIKISKFKKEVEKKVKGNSVINLHHSTLFLGLKEFDNVFVTYHGSPPAYDITKYPRNFINWFGRRSLKRARAVIVVSESLKKELVENGIKKEKVFVIPNGVSEDFKPTWKDENYMLYVGRLEEHKKVDQLIKIAKEYNFRLKIIGKGSCEKKLMKYASKIKSPTIFLGNVDRKKLIKNYQNCSFFVSGSEWEGFGLIFLEASRCGKPSIGYNSHAIKDIIKNNETGFLINNYEELGKRLNVLIKNKKKRKLMGKKAYNFSKKYSWDKTSDKYNKLFKGIKL